MSSAGWASKALFDFFNATPAGEARDALYEKLVAEMYQKGRATARNLEIDMVIDPAESRAVILRIRAGFIGPRLRRH